MFGMQCYLTDSEGFTGKIKQFCEDFEVTEINECGNLLQLTTSEMPPVLSAVTTSNVLDEATELNKEGQKDETYQNASKGYEPNEAQVSTGSGFPISTGDKGVSLDDQLKSLLGDAKFIELYKFADRWCAEGYKEMKQDLNLGCFNSKQNRAAVHVNIRMKFPFFKTYTKSTKKEESQTSEIFVSFDTVYQEFLNLMKDEDDVNRLFRFVHSINKKIGQTHNLKPDDDRKHRTLIHRLIAKHYGSFLESKTFSEENQGVDMSFIQVRVRFKATKGAKEKEKQGRSEIQSNDIYTGFVLKKTNIETLEAIQLLSKSLHTHPSAFSYAGIKDKKAVTQQYMVVRGVSPEQLARIQEDSPVKGIETGNYERNVPGPLKLGALQGNKFRIVIRDLQSAVDKSNVNLEKKVEEAMLNLSHNGFVNYYGCQRFGLESNSVNSCDVGLALLQGDFVHAVKLLLTPSGRQPEDQVDAAKRYYTETGDVSGALSKMPKNKTRECLILRSLRRHGNSMEGCAKAFMNIPFSMRLLYIHSYCSLLWNHMATWRLNMSSSMDVYEGDLVVDRDHFQAASMESDTSFNCEQKGEQTLEGGISKSNVKLVSSRDVTARRYSLCDVVLPMVGHSTIYPENEVGKRLKERMAADSLTNESFRVRSLGLNVPGAYRKLIGYPKSLEWQLVDSVSRRSQTLPIMESSCHEAADCRTKPDQEERIYSSQPLFKKQKLDEKISLSDGSNLDTSLLDEKQKVVKNLEVSFRLVPSCYATVCLREFMKT